MDERRNQVKYRSIIVNISIRRTHIMFVFFRFNDNLAEKRIL